MTTEPVSLIAIETFIQATRDSGYKNTASALAEIIDNSLQASASRLDVEFIVPEGERLCDVYILDDGNGMDPKTLQQAMRFGGSSRFGDRSGLGRYGMGLPNSSLSQARRLEVYSWQAGEVPHFVYIDIDEITAGEMTAVPEPVQRALPAHVASLANAAHGTLVVWARCDRLDNKRISTNVRKLNASLGRVFRAFIDRGVLISIDGVSIEPIDPLLRELPPGVQDTCELTEVQLEARAEPFGEPLSYEVRTPDGAAVGSVEICFTELPIHAWHDLPNASKRALGVSKGAGVSILRADREVDFGWHFLRGKRRENYDDWWRCEIRFDPILDEAFGITHTKQQIRPMDYLLELLCPDMEVIAKALNSRVRKAHAELKAITRFSEVERLAEAQDARLAPVMTAPTEREELAFEALTTRHPHLKRDATKRYYIIEEAPSKASTRSFFGVARNSKQQQAVILNKDHAFYKKVYGPLLDEANPNPDVVRGQLEVLLLTAARATAEGTEEERVLLEDWRERWGNILSTFLGR